MRQVRSTLAIYILKWLGYSLIIPAFGIFIRWLTSFVQAGPTDVFLADMFRESEVAFLAATILADTLGDAPDVGRDDPHIYGLIATRTLLAIFLVLSLLVFGALLPLTDTAEWLRDQGQEFHASLNITICAIAIATCLVTRWIYWRCEANHTPTRHRPSSSDSEAESCQMELNEENG